MQDKQAKGNWYSSTSTLVVRVLQEWIAGTLEKKKKGGGGECSVATKHKWYTFNITELSLLPFHIIFMITVYYCQLLFWIKSSEQNLEPEDLLPPMKTRSPASIIHSAPRCWLWGYLSQPPHPPHPPPKPSLHNALPLLFLFFFLNFALIFCPLWVFNDHIFLSFYLSKAGSCFFIQRPKGHAVCVRTCQRGLTLLPSLEAN